MFPFLDVVPVPCNYSHQLSACSHSLNQNIENSDPQILLHPFQICFISRVWLRWRRRIPRTTWTSRTRSSTSLTDSIWVASPYECLSTSTVSLLVWHPNCKDVINSNKTPGIHFHSVNTKIGHGQWFLCGSQWINSWAMIQDILIQ